MGPQSGIRSPGPGRPSLFSGLTGGRFSVPFSLDAVTVPGYRAMMGLAQIPKQRMDEAVSRRLGMGKIARVRLCEVCGEVMKVRRKTKRHCGPNCRKIAMRRRQREIE